MDKMKFETVDGAVRNVDKIAAMFPQVVTEIKGEDGIITRAVKWDVLKELLSGEYVEGGECYDFTWPGKRAAIAEAAKPIRKTLRPCKEESKYWDTTQNLYIEGDNLEVLKLLQESYLGNVKMIYIDPPYNTGNDFIYDDDFKMSSEQWEEESGSIAEDEETGDTVRMFKNTESNGRFHSDWCSMIYSRLQVAYDLLTEDGALFISIDDHELENIKKICSEIFGNTGFIGQIAVVNNLKGRNDKKDIAACHEYLVIYGKNCFEANGLPLSSDQIAEFNDVDDNGNRYQLRDLRKRGRPDRREDRPNMYFPIYYNPETKQCSLEEHNGWIKILPLRGDGSDGRWRWGKERVKANLSILEPKFSERAQRWGIEHRVYLNPALNPAADCDEEDGECSERTAKAKSIWLGGSLSSDVARRQYKDLMNDNSFDYPKSVDLISNVIFMGCGKEDIALDFFSGSATTAHAIMKVNAEDGGKRKFIMVQLPEVCAPDSEAAKAGYKTICEIGKERIRRAGEKIKEEAGLAAADLDVGFRVFKVADSNMKDVYYSADEYSQDELDGLVSNIKEDRTDLDLLYGCLLEWGVELSLPHTSETIDGVTVHTVNSGDLIACFDQNIPESAIRKIAKRHPLRAVFRDSSFASAPQKINLEEIFKLLSPATTVKVI